MPYSCILSVREKEIEIRSVSVYHYGRQSVYQLPLQIKGIKVLLAADKEAEILAQQWKMTSLQCVLSKEIPMKRTLIKKHRSDWMYEMPVNRSKNKQKLKWWKTHLLKAAGRAQVKISHHKSINCVGEGGQQRGRNNKQPPITAQHDEVIWLHIILKANTACTSFLSLFVDGSLEQDSFCQRCVHCMICKEIPLPFPDWHTLMNLWHSGDRSTLMLPCNTAADIMSWFNSAFAVTKL